jgi:hypothetical protein
MPLDEALQKAKKGFKKTLTGEKSCPITGQQPSSWDKQTQYRYKKLFRGSA